MLYCVRGLRRKKGAALAVVCVQVFGVYGNKVSTFAGQDPGAMPPSSIAFVSAFLLSSVSGLDNGAARTPSMGWYVRI
jgi:hypothetical protein